MYYRIEAMEQLDTQSILVIFIAAVVAVQGIGTALCFMMVARRCRQQRAAINQLSLNASQKLHQMEEILDRTAGIGEKLPGLVESVSRQLEIASKGAERVDMELARAIGAVREGVSRTDRRLESGLVQFQRQTRTVERVVRHPSIQVAAVVKAGLTFLRQMIEPRAEDSDSGPPSSDEEIFI